MKKTTNVKESGQNHPDEETTGQLESLIKKIDAERIRITTVAIRIDPNSSRPKEVDVNEVWEGLEFLLLKAALRHLWEKVNNGEINTKAAIIEALQKMMLLTVDRTKDKT